MNWKIFCISITIASMLAFGLHALSGLNFWISLVMVVCGMLLNGYIATIEDDWPGGFNNPEPEISETQQRVAKATQRFLPALIYRRFADVSYSVQFSSRNDGTQTGTLRRILGAAALGA
jgi:hypothetical protein